jgi:ribonuclease HII
MGLFQAAPSLSAEIAAWRRGFRHVAGLDEAGRGPLAGPVVAGAAILEPGQAREWWSELRDSKLLTYDQRQGLDERVRAECAHGVGVATHEEIDTIGLIAATKLAMRRALAALPCRPDLVLIDAVTLPEYRHRSLIHGDALCASIAAGSILAKVHRDTLMEQYHPVYPAYAFHENRGYATPEHKRALDEHGPCPIHRRLFAPVRAVLEARGEPIHLPFRGIEPLPAGAG